jgi:mannose-1-phosphate guanylyltransferase / mannose-6-phosphate isomerase
VIIPVIMCGGAGSRLWPLSRESHPKPFIRMSDGRSMLQHAADRAAAIDGASGLIVVTNTALLFTVRDHLDDSTAAGLPRINILEPQGRDTTAAIAAAALEVERAHGADAILLVLPADHMIDGLEAFAGNVAQAAELAKEGRIVTFGIRPTHPETGYGYIETAGGDVLRFVEKPSPERAQIYLDAGNFFWNSGMFCFSAGTMLAAMAAHCPDILADVRSSLAAAKRNVDLGQQRVDIDPVLFAGVRKQSIDFSVMEKVSNIAMVQAGFTWSDIGSWASFADMGARDALGNTVIGDARTHDTRNSFILGSGRLVAAVGVDNLVIVDTPDALLVADRRSAQDVKEVYNQLKAEHHPAHDLHQTVHRPWGSYTVLEEGPRFKIKRIEVKPGGRLSLQSHKHRSEHWVVVAGEATVVNGDTELTLHHDQSTYIPCGAKHRLENKGIESLAIIEVQTGDYLGEDDIVRYEDVYGRS